MGKVRHKIAIKTGFTNKSRELNAKKATTRWEELGWDVIERIDGGISKTSYLVIERDKNKQIDATDMSFAEKASIHCKEPNQPLDFKSIISFVLLLIVLSVFVFGENSDGFAVLVLLSILVGFLGLIKPSIVGLSNRKGAVLGGIGGFLIFTIAFGVTYEDGEIKTKSEKASKIIEEKAIEPNIKHNTKDDTEQKTVEAMMLKDSVNESVTCNQKLLSGTIFVGCSYIRANYQRQALFVVKDNKIQAVTGSAMVLVEHALKYDGYTPEQAGYYLNMLAVNVQKAYVELNISDDTDSDFMDKPIETQGSDDNRQLIKEKEKNMLNDITPIKQVSVEKREFPFTYEEFIRVYNKHLAAIGSDIRMTLIKTEQSSGSLLSTISSNVDAIGLLVTSNKETNRVNSITFIGVGDGSQQSGEYVTVGMAITVKAIENPDLKKQNNKDIFKEIEGLKMNGDTIKFIRNGVKYAVSLSEYTGLWLIAGY